MFLRINNNIPAVIGHRHLLIVQDKIKKSLECLSSGYRINKAADDAAGIAIRSGLRADIASYKQATRNASQAISMIQVAEGALSKIDSILMRMKKLSIQASSVNASGNLDKLDIEFQCLGNEIDRIASSTSHADIALLDGTLSEDGMQIQLGSGKTQSDTLDIEMGNATLIGLGIATASSPEKIGSEFQINTTAVNSQGGSSVTNLSDGGFVVTWHSYNQDGSGYGVYGQRYDSSGNAVGSEFLVNTEINDHQYHSSVTGLSDRGFVVTWHSYNQDGSDFGIYGQRYDSSGAAAGSEFLINTETYGRQENPSVTGLSDGGFVVTWTSNGQDGSAEGIYGQIFSSPYVSESISSASSARAAITSVDNAIDANLSIR